MKKPPLSDRLQSLSAVSDAENRSRSSPTSVPADDLVGIFVGTGVTDHNRTGSIPESRRSTRYQHPQSADKLAGYQQSGRAAANARLIPVLLENPFANEGERSIGALAGIEYHVYIIEIMLKNIFGFRKYPQIYPQFLMLPPLLLRLLFVGSDQWAHRFGRALRCRWSAAHRFQLLPPDALTVWATISWATVITARCHRCADGCQRHSNGGGWSDEVHHRPALRQPAAWASDSVQNQRSPIPLFILTLAYVSEPGR